MGYFRRRKPAPPDPAATRIAVELHIDDLVENGATVNVIPGGWIATLPNVGAFGRNLCLLTLSHIRTCGWAVEDIGGGQYRIQNPSGGERR